MTSEYSLVSICTPCYNHEKYIPDYLQGLMSQTYPRLELIIVDDCSRDGSFDMLCKAIPMLESKFERVVLKRNPKNLGINRTCNILFREAKGEYVKQTASDDILLPDFVEELVQLMQENPDVMLAMGNAVSVKDSYRYGDEYDPTEKLLDINELSSCDNLHGRLLKANIVGVGKLFRRDVFDVCGYYDENLSFEDWDYLLTYTKEHRIAFVDKTLVLYRDSESSLSRYYNNRNRRDRRMKFLRMFYGTIQLFEKHLPEEERKQRIEKHLSDSYGILFKMKRPWDLRMIVLGYASKHGYRLPEGYTKPTLAGLFRAIRRKLK